MKGAIIINKLFLANKCNFSHLENKLKYFSKIKIQQHDKVTGTLS